MCAKYSDFLCIWLRKCDFLTEKLGIGRIRILKKVPDPDPQHWMVPWLEGSTNQSINPVRWHWKETKSADQTTSESRQELTELDTDMKNFHFEAKISPRTLGMYISYLFRHEHIMSFNKALLHLQKNRICCTLAGSKHFRVDSSKTKLPYTN